VPVDDLEAFYAACQEVLADPSLHRRLAQGARKSSRAYDSSVMTDRYDTLFEAAVEGRDIPARLR
jgi:glycosyltransferase involved in cell wall biosynthesis